MNDTDTPLVWLLDDDKAIRDSLGMLLECEGFRVRIFETGAGLLAGLPDRPQGCLLLDLDMPGMDGFAVMAALRERGIQIPIIVCTGRGDATESSDVLRGGGAVCFASRFRATRWSPPCAPRPRISIQPSNKPLALPHPHRVSAQ